MASLSRRPIGLMYNKCLCLASLRTSGWWYEYKIDQHGRHPFSP